MAEEEKAVKAVGRAVVVQAEAQVEGVKTAVKAASLEEEDWADMHSCQVEEAVAVN